MNSFSEIFSRFSFRSQIIALFTVAIFSLAIIGSLVASWVINNKLSDLVLNQGRQITATLAHLSILPLLSGLGENARIDLESTRNDYPNIKGIGIYTKDGALLIGTGTLKEDRIPAGHSFPSNGRAYQSVISQPSKYLWELVAPVYNTDVDEVFNQEYKRLGYVRVTIDRSDLNQTQQQLLYDSLLISLGIAFIATLIVILVTRQMTRPIFALASLMKNAEDGDNNIRANLTGPNEITSMAYAFNTMMSALERRRDDLEQQKQSLLHEINERETAEQALMDSESRLKSIFENVVDGIITLDEHRIIESCNPAAEILLSPAQQLIGKHINTALSNFRPSSLIDDSVFDNHTTTPQHISLINTHGRKIDLNIKISQMLIKGIEKFIAILIDITDSQRQQERIASLLAKHEAIISTIPGIIFELNKDGKLIWWNKRVEDLSGYTPAELKLKDVLDFLPEYEKTMAEKAISKSFIEGSSELHAEIITTKGIVPYQFISVRTLHGENKPPTLLGVGMDESQSVRAQNALQKARDAALESAKIKSEFLANMSHEIRTPMNGMVGMLQLLAESPLNQVQQTYADIALRSSDQLLNIINDILDLSKMEAGKLSFSFVDFSPRVIIEDVLDLFSQRAHEKRLHIYSQICIDTPELIKGDPTRFHQIISNLVGNAIKFTEQGHIHVSCKPVIAPDAKDNVGRLHIAISDTGIGIPDSAKLKIFDSFVQADGSLTRKHSGTGLGLAIVHQLVGMMGGHIEVDSTQDEGSTFHIEMPIIVSEASCLRNSINKHQQIKALYVGNDSILANILEDYLEAFNCTLDRKSRDDYTLSPNNIDNNITFIDRRYFEDIESYCHDNPACSKIVIIYQKHETHCHNDTRRIEKPIRFNAIESIIKRITITKDSSDVPSIPTVPAKKYPEIKILIVEDNVTNQRVIMSMLSKLGYDPVIVNNGLEAIERTKIEKFDLILMDCQMPIMDGYQATLTIRSQPASEKQPVIIAMTGNAMEGDREKCIRVGMDDYMAKPIRFTELKTLLTKWAMLEPV